MSEAAFGTKWSSIKQEDTGSYNHEERSIFVELGQEPSTQRQFNLYHYFEFIRQELERHGVRDVIEIGCGRGTMGLYMAKHMGLSVSLLDNVPSAIELAKEEFAQHGQKASYYVEDVLATHFTDQSFDAIVSIGLAEHFEAPKVRELFAEQFRLLRPGGVMISLNIPKKFSIQHLNFLMRAVKKIFGMYTGSPRKDYFRNVLSATEYGALAEGAGFEQISLTHVLPFPILVPVKMSTDRLLTRIYLSIIRFRRTFQKSPLRTNSVLAQSHFVVGVKPPHVSGEEGVVS